MLVPLSTVMEWNLVLLQCSILQQKNFGYECRFVCSLTQIQSNLGLCCSISFILQITHMEMIKGIQGHGYYDDLVVPIIENTAHERELTDSLAEAVCFFPSLLPSCRFYYLHSIVYSCVQFYKLSNSKVFGIPFPRRRQIDNSRMAFETIALVHFISTRKVSFNVQNN